MSLLMQALKKAERARQNGLPEEHAAGPDDWDLAPRDEALAGDLPESGLVTPAAVSAPPPSAALGELSLEPLEPTGSPLPPPEAKREPTLASHPEPGPDPTPAPAPAKAARTHSSPPIPLEPATEALHDPVPPQARHEPARGRAATGARPAEARTKASAPAATRPEAAAARAGAAARARAAAAADQPGVDMARMRVMGLSGIALVIFATFGYVYWRATTAPGPGAALPMVPMPPPSATGATGIVVAPVGPPLGPTAAALPAGAEMPAGAMLAATPAPDQPATSAPAVTTPAAPSSALPAAVAVAPVQAPSTPPRAAAPPPESYLTDDPAGQRAARLEETERMMRAERDRPTGAAAVAPATVAAPTSAAPVYAPAPMAGADSGTVHIARGSSQAIVPAVGAAYAAFVAGDYAAARQEYDNALRQDPNNRDALLGSAAVAQRDNRGPQAAAAYARLLELDPADPDALAALVALRPGDLARSETQLRHVLKNRPDAAPVLFALGNLYARQGRWPEAQQAYFRAYTAAPDNADYAFNLAVGLDRLNQGRLAVNYYRQALAATGPAAFDRAAVQRRLRELQEAAPARAATTPTAPAAPLPERGN